MNIVEESWKDSAEVLQAFQYVEAGSAVIIDASLQDFRLNDLRHCASTNLRRAGVDIATAMQIIGHKSEKMWKRYNSIEQRDLTNAASKLDKYLQAADADTVMTLDDFLSCELGYEVIDLHSKPA